MNKLGIKDIDLKDKFVLMRVDFNVPLDENCNITDDARIKAALPSIKYVLEQKAKKSERLGIQIARYNDIDLPTFLRRRAMLSGSGDENKHYSLPELNEWLIWGIRVGILIFLFYLFIVFVVL